MSKFIEFSESPRGWCVSYLSRVARRAVAVAVVVGAGAGMVSAQSNFAASGSGYSRVLKSWREMKVEGWN